MCRIAGIVHAGFPVSILEEKVRIMCDLLKHGGPDDDGIYISTTNNIVLGNRRLALIDLTSDGHMPMPYQERYFITYNGELYNFLVLKEELAALGYSFKNHTDTEVILAAFAQWNEQSFSKLKGMFAFALWDSLKKDLFLVRDPSGIKPLYFASKGDMLVFASEVRAFAPIESLHEPDRNWPVYLMAYGYIPEPVTTLKDVKPLHKGCFLKYSLPGRQLSIQSFTHYSLTHQLHHKEEVMTSMKVLLENAVKRHLIADAPLGVFLSGGLDSGIIALLAEKHKKADLNTLSIYFEETEYSEKKYQDILKERLQCHHNQYLLKENEFHASFSEILDSMDMPSCDGINTWFISKYAASQGLKAVLSGIGGDELFGGYPSFKRISAANLLQRMPNEIVRMGKRTSAKRLNRMSYLSMGGIKGIYLFLRGHYSPFEIAKRLECTEKEIWTILEEQPLFMDISELENKNQASWMEFNLYMQNQLLRDSDVMSMIHGVEIRVPFLDDEIVRLAFKTDPAIKFEGPLAKQVLINSYKDLLPEAIWNRPKMGFSFPFAKWLRSSDYVENLMESGNIYALDKYKKFTNGKLHWSHMMSLIILNKRNI
jgi:asparagine synthase (glutamine-hydrolysing)